MWDRSVSTIGIMFNEHRVDGLFPRAHRVVNTYSVPEELHAWCAVAYDPRGLYADADSEAMDETNFDAILDSLPTPQRVDWYSGSGLEDALLCGIALVDGHLLIEPTAIALEDSTSMVPETNEDEDDLLIDRCVELREQLESYPLLDEDAYSALEWQAWNEYLLNGLSWDTARDLKEHGADEATVEAVEEGWADIAPTACNYLHYWSGFSGEHGPDFAECVAHAFIDALIGRRTFV